MLFGLKLFLANAEKRASARGMRSRSWRECRPRTFRGRTCPSPFQLETVMDRREALAGIGAGG